MAIKMVINLGNAAFEDGKEEEVARIISEAADKVADGRTDFKLMDVNGNSVGRLWENGPLIESALDEQCVTLEIETENAAFEDAGMGYESARIMREAAGKIRGGDLDFKLRDVNGNTVGKVQEVGVLAKVKSGVGGLDSIKIKSITPVLIGKEWVIRARLSDNAERFKGVGAGYNLAQAQSCANARGAPRVGQLSSVLDEDLEPNMESGAYGSSVGMPSCWVAGKAIEQKKETPEISLYEALKSAGIEMGHHASDLYVPVTPETKAILAKYPLQQKNASTFRANVTGELTYDIPFAYDPAWEKKAGITVADIRPDIKGKLLVEKAVSLDDAELHRVFDSVAAPEFCIRQAQNARNAGLTMRDIRLESLQEDLQRLEDAGISVDVVEATIVVQTGTAPEKGEFSGKVLKVDDVLDVVYLSKGMGAARALPLKALSRVPEHNEMVKVTFKDFKGEVKGIEKGLEKGGR